jgi:hypothetical protein
VASLQSGGKVLEPHLVQPPQFFHNQRQRGWLVLAMRSRLIPDGILSRFERRAHRCSSQPSASRPDAGRCRGQDEGNVELGHGLIN